MSESNWNREVNAVATVAKRCRSAIWRRFTILTIVIAVAVVLVSALRPVSDSHAIQAINKELPGNTNRKDKALQQELVVSPVATLDNGHSAQWGAGKPVDLAALEEVRKDATRVCPQSPKTFQKAVALFETQRDNWLSIQSAKAKFRVVRRQIMPDGRLEPDKGLPTRGTIYFAVKPSEAKDRNKSPVLAALRVEDGQSRWIIDLNDALDPKASVTVKSIDSAGPIQDERRDVFVNAVPRDLLFRPFDVAAKSYPGKWGSNPFTEPRERFYEWRGVPWRITGPGEDSALFKGRPQYLFRITPDADYWFDAEAGDLSRIDVKLSDTETKSFIYDEYQDVNQSGLRYPRRQSVTWMSSKDGKVVGWQHTIILSDLQINEESND